MALALDPEIAAKTVHATDDARITALQPFRLPDGSVAKNAVVASVSVPVCEQQYNFFLRKSIKFSTRSAIARTLHDATVYAGPFLNGPAYRASISADLILGSFDDTYRNPDWGLFELFKGTLYDHAVSNQDRLGPKLGRFYVEPKPLALGVIMRYADNGRLSIPEGTEIQDDGLLMLPFDLQSFLAGNERQEWSFDVLKAVIDYKIGRLNLIDFLSQQRHEHGILVKPGSAVVSVVSGFETDGLEAIVECTDNPFVVHSNARFHRAKTEKNGNGKNLFFGEVYNTSPIPQIVRRVGVRLYNSETIGQNLV